MHQNEGLGNGYLSTGAFAKLCNVSKHTLFHYMDTGVFVPDYIDEKGYRYYHVLQYDMFCTITQLRTIGMSLKDIKTYLEDRSPSKLIELCSEQEALIDKKIKTLKAIKSNLKATRLDVKEALMVHDKFFIREEGQEHLHLSKVMHGADNVEMTHVFGDLLASNERRSFKVVSGMVHLAKAIKNDAPMNQYMFYLKVPCKKKSCDCVIKPKGSYLVTYHCGGYDSLKDTYKALLKHAEERKLTLGDWVYDEMVIGDWAVKTVEEYVIKVSVQIVT